MALVVTTSQTVGPFFHLGLSLLDISDIAGPEIPGQRMAIEGRVLDGDRVPVSDAILEFWQANCHGKYADEAGRQDTHLNQNFKGYGRVPTNSDGLFRLKTIKPGRVPGPNGSLQAPHIEVSVFMRGLLKQLITRIYFPDDPANTEDPILKLVAPERRSTLIGRWENAAQNVLRWDVL
ncbi:MAG: protocatechuate 3,4-dioxygenase subunit alpha, partial [Acidobacteriaceae bacterium]|nr:protocatechuate 3,4-dioxygenase subunit alpha [Acidobacteriaceae bacterium]